MRLDGLKRRLAAHRPDRKLAELGARLESLRKSLDLQFSRALKSRQEQLANLARTLHAVSPLETIGRGYSVLTAADSAEVVSRVAQVSAGDGVTAQVADGFLDCTVDTVRKAGEP